MNEHKRMKMVINADGVNALVKLDPENTVELAKGAACQVATEIANRLVRHTLEQKIRDVLLNQFNSGLKGWGKQVESQVVLAIRNEAQRVVTELMGGNIKAMLVPIMNEVVKENSEKMLNEMRELADQVIRERFAVMFATKTNEGK